ACAACTRRTAPSVPVANEPSTAIRVWLALAGAKPATRICSSATSDPDAPWRRVPLLLSTVDGSFQLGLIKDFVADPHPRSATKSLITGGWGAAGVAARGQEGSVDGEPRVGAVQQVLHVAPLTLVPAANYRPCPAVAAVGVPGADVGAERDQLVVERGRRSLGRVGALVLDADRLVVLADGVRADHHAPA